MNVCYLRHYIPTLKIIKCSLIEPGVVAENQPNPVNDGPIGPGVIRQCMNAAIGLGYNGKHQIFHSQRLKLTTVPTESSILVAMRSHRFPLPTAIPAPFTAMNMDLSLDVTQPPVSEDMGIEWETWGEETTIDLCEIQLRFDGSVMGGSCVGLQSTPLTSPEISYICKPLTTDSQSVESLKYDHDLHPTSSSLVARSNAFAFTKAPN